MIKTMTTMNSNDVDSNNGNNSNNVDNSNDADKDTSASNICSTCFMLFPFNFLSCDLLDKDCKIKSTEANLSEHGMWDV